MKHFSFCQRITDLKRTIVRQTDDITRPSLVNSRLTLCHELCGRRKTHCLSMTHMQVWSITCKFTWANLTECDTRTMIRVDIRRNLKDKSGEFRLFRFHFTFFRLYRTRAWSYLYKAIQQLLHTKVIQSWTKEYRCQFALQIFFFIKFRINSIYQFQLTTQLISQLRTDLLIQFFGIDIYLHLFRHHLLGRLEKIQIVFVDVINSLKAHTTFDRPGQRTYMNGKLFLQLIQQIERIFGLTVHLIDEYNDRRITHTAHFHQLTRLCFHTFGTIYNDDNAIYSSQRTICVFSEILMTGSIEDINLILFIVELHHRGGYRDTTLLLYIHPVRCSGFLYLIALYSTCHLDLSTKKQ